MYTETALGAKLKRAGYNPREVRFQIAVTEFLNNGGTLDRAHELIAVAADKMESDPGFEHSAYKAVKRLPNSPTHDAEGHRAIAGKAIEIMPKASPNASEGQIAGADKAVVSLPSDATERSGAGFKASADKAVIPLSASASKPGHARRGSAAIASVQSAMSKSLFDTNVLPDGRRLREVRWGECPTLATKYRRMSRILMAVHGVGTPTDPTVTIDQIVSEDRLKGIIEAVERVNDIH